MCGIAGVIHRNGSADIGLEMTRMLDRWPSRSGLDRIALYGPPSESVVFGSSSRTPTGRNVGFLERLERHKMELESGSTKREQTSGSSKL